MLGIEQGANAIGMHTLCARISISYFAKAPLPCILHWNQNHFVILYKIKRGKKFYIADPAKGLVNLKSATTRLI